MTLPPIAAVGLSEAAVRNQARLRVNSGKATDWYTARRVGEPVYGYKTLVEAESGRILGAHLVGHRLRRDTIFVGLFTPVNVRTAICIIALSWMGTACILNAKRCGRTHCHYTGPYYLAMIVPVVVLGSGFAQVALAVRQMRSWWLYGL